MSQAAIKYSNILIKQQIETWGEGLEFDAEEQILMLLEDKYGPADVTVIDARPECDCLMLAIATALWKDPKEFALLKSGSLAW
jgi:hypothetical protein